MLDPKGDGWMLWDGVQIALAVAFCAMVLALMLGLIGTTGKLSSHKIADAAADTYTNVIRGVPEPLLILIVYYGAPTLIQDTAERFGYDILIDIDPFIAGAVTIGFIYGAFATEVFRSACLAVPRGQIEAARACGMPGGFYTGASSCPRRSAWRCRPTPTRRCFCSGDIPGQHRHALGLDRDRAHHRGVPLRGPRDLHRRRHPLPDRDLRYSLRLPQSRARAVGPPARTGRDRGIGRAPNSGGGYSPRHVFR